MSSWGHARSVDIGVPRKRANIDNIVGLLSYGLNLQKQLIGSSGKGFHSSGGSRRLSCQRKLLASFSISW